MRVAFAALLYLSQVQADLPVHCLHSQILGQWSLKMSDAGDHKYIQCSDAKNSFEQGDFGVNGSPKFKSTKAIDVTLFHPDRAYAKIDGKDVHGKWTMVYDEGFEVKLAQQKFFAFSKFKQGATLGGEGAAAVKRRVHESDCAATLPGWFHSMDKATGLVQAGTWGCYYGVKKGKADPYEAPVLLEAESTTQTLVELDAPSPAYKPEKELVQQVNDRGGSWKAALYPELLEGKTMAEIHQLRGGNLKSVHQVKAAAPKVDKLKLAAAVKTSDLPGAFDWTNIKGKNFVDEVINQGACGSCYAVSSTAMLSSRLRIQARKEGKKAQLSPQSVLDCSELNQGCSGGYPYLVQKFVSENGMPAEEDMPYKGTSSWLQTDSEDKSKARAWVDTCSKNQVAAKVTHYGYVGGYYGACTEAAMKREIKDHGPIVVAYEVSPEFQHYRSGVFEASQVAPATVNEWEETNHAVLVTGWGMEGNTPYWNVRNSWGANWGEKGYFRILRGKDSLAIESMAVAAMPQPAAASAVNLDEDTWLERIN